MAAKPGSDQVYRGAPRPKLSPEQAQVLVQLVQENPLLSLDDLVGPFRKRTGISLSPPTIQKYLLEAGFKRAPLKGKRAEEKPEASPRYGYTAAHRDPGDSTRYPGGLMDAEWERIEHLFDPPGRRGRPEKYPRRQVLDACVYVLRSGCSWRMLPKDFPDWPVVYRTFRRWQARGLFETMHDELRVLWRSRLHRAAGPTAVVIDSQSVSTSEQGGPKGYDAGKKVKGRKRHLVTDTLGLMLAVLVTTASTQDRDAAVPALDLAVAKAPALQKVYADTGYRGSRAREIQQRYGIEVEIVRRPQHGKRLRWDHPQLQLIEPEVVKFTPLPKRWVIERTNAWNARPRRMAKDQDRNLDVSTAWIWLAEARLLLRRVVS